MSNVSSIWLPESENSQAMVVVNVFRHAIVYISCDKSYEHCMSLHGIQKRRKHNSESGCMFEITCSPDANCVFIC